MNTERFIEILELAWPAYQENVDKFVAQHKSGEWYIVISDRAEIPFMCWHITSLRREGKITREECNRTRYRIMDCFVGSNYRTAAGMLVNQYNLEQDIISKVRGARLYWLHVIGPYKMYDEFPPNHVIVEQMKETHPELFSKYLNLHKFN